MKDPLDILSSLNQFVIRLMKPFLWKLCYFSPFEMTNRGNDGSFRVCVTTRENLFRDDRGFTFLSYIYGINISKVLLPVASDMRYRIECVNDISRAHTCACKWRAVVRDMQSPNPQRHTLVGIAALLIHIFRSFVVDLFVRCETRFESHACVRIYACRQIFPQKWIFFIMDIMRADNAHKSLVLCSWSD